MFTFSSGGDSPVLPDLLSQIPPDEQIGTVTGDGAFDTRRCHTTIKARGGTAVIQIRRTGRLWNEDCPAARARNDILRAIKLFGRVNWKRWSGHHVRGRMEARMRSQVRSNLWCLTCSTSSPSASASSHESLTKQKAENYIRVALMNRFNAPGTAEINRVA